MQVAARQPNAGGPAAVAGGMFIHISFFKIQFARVATFADGTGLLPRAF